MAQRGELRGRGASVPSTPSVRADNSSNGEAIDTLPHSPPPRDTSWAAERGDEVPTSARPNRPSGEDNLIGAIAARYTTARVTARSLGRRINNSVWRAFLLDVCDAAMSCCSAAVQVSKCQIAPFLRSRMTDKAHLRGAIPR